MIKKKLGVWLPTRPILRRVSQDNPGIFLDIVVSAILKELKKEFIIIENLDFRNASIKNGAVFFNDFNASELDGYFWFSQMNKDADGHDMLVLEQLEKSIPVINPTRGLRIGLDKFKTSSFLQENKIPVPEFALIHKNDEKTIGWIFDNWGSILVKPRFGAFGVGIFKTDSADDLLDLIDFSGVDSVYVEKFYKNDASEWCGINVVGNNILYAYGKQETKIKGYKVFDRMQIGGDMVLRHVNAEQKKLALKIAELIKMGFFGIDLIRSKDGRYLVVDLNTFPGVYPELSDPKKIATEFLRMIKMWV